jgi:bifunctional UDP-N-acetylglucosamine pyrophosphorylase / glucosamine-1-phosphate N-acetyltransferase
MSSANSPVAIILAAGKSTRMKSDLPKVLHPVGGRPMIEHVLDATRAAGVERIVVVVGHQAERVEQALAHHKDVEFALQSEQNGTGHAVMMCADALADHDGSVLILAGDTPLLRGSSLARLLAVQKDENAAAVIGTAVTDANEGLGRIVRDPHGEFVKIVEQRDATPEQLAIREINTGCYVFDNQLLFNALKRVRTDNQQGEYYLTDCPAILLSDGQRVVASDSLDIVEAKGVNTPEQLADVERTLAERSSTR